MSILNGSSDVASIFVGSSSVREVYVGSTLVFSAATWTPRDGWDNAQEPGQASLGNARTTSSDYGTAQIDSLLVGGDDYALKIDASTSINSAGDLGVLGVGTVSLSNDNDFSSSDDEADLAYIRYSSSGVTPGFSVTFTAPASGAVYINCYVNAADGLAELKNIRIEKL